MDLIHATDEKREIGFIDDFIKFDAEIATKAEIQNNQFVLTMDEDVWSKSEIRKGHFVYIPYTEWGGPVEYVKHSTKTAQVTMKGPTWRGMLIRKIVEPPPDEAYFVLSNVEANAAIQQLVGDMFGDFFVISEEDTEINVSGSWRYGVLLNAITEALTASGLSLFCGYDNTLRKATLEARKITDYSSRVDLSQDYGIHLTSEQGGIESYNHIIALGRGELTEREVVHLYRLNDGTITTVSPGNRGVQDRCTTFDYPNAESTEELVKDATKRLKEYVEAQTVQMDTSETGLSLELGDKVSARDRLTGLVTVAPIQRKILVITSENEKIETKVG